MRSYRWAATVLLLALPGCHRSPSPAVSAGSTPRWCGAIPRPANTAFDRVTLPTAWFEIYRVDDGIYAFVEANQFQETISYLIVGSERALLFDTGLGMVPIRPLVEQLTTLPVEVLNSHTHYDHVGGNAEFERILAVNTPYTTANQAGFPHPELAGEVAPDAFCHGPPAGLDTAGFHTRAWRPFRTVADGDTIALGGRILEVIQVPGHTPDAVALLDRARGLLWTGDSYYDATIWLYVPETDLDGYDRSMSRLAALAPNLRRLLPAHNTIAADPAHLALALDAIRQVRQGTVSGVEQSDQRRVFRFGAFSILTSVPLLEGKAGDRTRGGSGLTTWR
jgi:glyoxylase-like metal-dependent hydrolase (beta-lactamase superfamily II)